MDTQEKLWALTFVIRDYCYATGSEKAETFYGYWKPRALCKGISMLFEHNVLAPEELSQEIKERTGVRIYPEQLKRYAEGITFELKIVDKNSDQLITDQIGEE